jgi:outer membrane protein
VMRRQVILRCRSFFITSLWCLAVSLGMSMAGCSNCATAFAEEHFLPQKEAVGLRPAGLRKDQSSTDRHDPLTLDRAIEEALRASPELNQIQQRINAAMEQVRQATAAFYPRIVLSEEYNATDNPVFALMNIINQRRLKSSVNFNHPGEQQNYSSRVQGELSLFEGGSRWYNRKAALDIHDSVRSELLAAQNVLVSKVTEIYYQWLKALDFIGVAEKTSAAAKTDVRLAEARKKAEVALRSEVMRLKAREAEVQGDLVSARAGARRLQAGLERLLARSIRPDEIPGEIQTTPFTPSKDIDEKPDVLVTRALDNRPEMAAVRSLVQAARKRVRSAEGGLWPKLDTRASYQWDSENLSEGEDSWIFAIRFSWPIFEGGLTLSKIREARIRLKELESRGEQVALDVALEVNQASLALQEAVEKIKVAEERRLYAQEALEEIRQQYRHQVATVDSLLQTEVAWNRAEVAYTSALFEGKIAEALLRQSLGEFANWMEAHNE